MSRIMTSSDGLASVFTTWIGALYEKASRFVIKLKHNNGNNNNNYVK